MRRRRVTYSDKPASKFAKSIIWGTFSGSIICTILLFAAAFLFTKIGYIPDNMMSTVTVIITCIGVFFGGYIAAKISKQKGLLVGFMVGILIFLIITAISVIVIKQPVTLSVLTKAVIIIVTGAIGGLLGVSQF